MREEYDFSQGTRGPVIPQPGKTRITLWVDTDVYEAYMAYAARICRSVTPDMNLALRQYIEYLVLPLPDRIRALEEALREARVELAQQSGSLGAEAMQQARQERPHGKQR